MTKIECIAFGLSEKPNNRKGCFGYSSISVVQDNDECILCDVGNFGERCIIYDVINTYHITKVFISHLHFDHCTNIDLFPEIPIYINKYELEELFSKNPNIDINVQLKYFIDKLTIVSFDKEIMLGDNTKIKLTYGHTMGHSSLEVCSNDGKCLIAGDCIKNKKDYDSPMVYENAWNPQMHIETKRKLHDKYYMIVPGHAEPIIIAKNRII